MINDYNQKIFNVRNTFLKKDLIKIKSIHHEIISNLNTEYLQCLNIVNNRNQLIDINYSANLFADCSFIIIIGTGGSSLGSKMLISAVGNSKKKFFFAENVDPDTNQRLISKVDLKKTGFIVISKSGETIETLCIYFFFLNALKNKNINIKKRTLVLTENKPSSLKIIQEKRDYHFFEHDKNIGGRYSVFSSVGLIPAKIAGAKIKDFCEGGQNILNNLQKIKSPELLYPIRGALVKTSLMRKGYNQSILLTYADRLINFTKWYVQLWSESIGKKNKGSTAISSIGTIDQHSQLQLFLDGPKDKFITILGLNKPQKSKKLDCKIAKEISFENLHGKSMGELFFAEKKATFQSLMKKKIPLRSIDLNQISEKILGKIVMSFFLETIYACKLLHINPFNQPAVEEGKILALKFLQNAKS